MAATIKIKATEATVLGEVDTYALTLKVVDAEDIDPNIFIVEYTRTNPRLKNKYDSEFHHVAYLPEMDSVGTELDDSSHQYIRQSKITRTYATIERMQESKKVMLQDITSLLKARNELGENLKESEILVTEDGYTYNVTDMSEITLDGEAVRW